MCKKFSLLDNNSGPKKQQLENDYMQRNHFRMPKNVVYMKSYDIIAIICIMCIA